jgi:predicted Rossmann fold flavoprotein
MAAIAAARAGSRHAIIVLDGARRLGAKILISGGGRCNITNSTVTARDFNGGSPRVITRVLRAFPVDTTVRFFETLGVPLHEESNGKLFPDSNRAATVLDALLGEASRLGIDVRPSHRVQAITPAAGGFEVMTQTGAVHADRVVLACGGMSVPSTGSDGSGYALARALGHTIVPTTPALAPLLLDGTFHRELSGVSHPVALTIRSPGTTPRRVTGDWLWTHFGASGPAALDASRHWHRTALEGRDSTMDLSFTPGEPVEAIDARLLAEATSRPRASLAAALASLVPASVAARLVTALQPDPAGTMSHLSRDDRRRTARALTAWAVRVSGSRGFNYAEATAGGVSLDEIDPATMESRVCRGLFLAGEVLDVDGRLGGFNFQWAWASGSVAGRGVA